MSIVFNSIQNGALCGVANVMFLHTTNWGSRWVSWIPKDNPASELYTDAFLIGITSYSLRRILAPHLEELLLWYLDGERPAHPYKLATIFVLSAIAINIAAVSFAAPRLLSLFGRRITTETAAKFALFSALVCPFFTSKGY